MPSAFRVSFALLEGFFLKQIVYRCNHTEQNSFQHPRDACLFKMKSYTTDRGQAYRFLNCSSNHSRKAGKAGSNSFPNSKNLGVTKIFPAATKKYLGRKKHSTWAC